MEKKKTNERNQKGRRLERLAWLGGNEEMLKRVNGVIDAISMKTLGIKLNDGKWYNTKDNNLKEVISGLSKGDEVILSVDDMNNYFAVKKIVKQDKSDVKNDINLSVCLKAIAEIKKGSNEDIEKIASDTIKLYNLLFGGNR